MELTLSLLALFTTPLLSAALPSPSGIPLSVSPGINTSSHAPSQPLNCTDIQDGISPQCYLTLNVTAYLENYNISILRETCSPTQTWSSCFQINAYANPATKTGSPTVQTIGQQHDCSTLTTNTSNSDTCTAPGANEESWSPQAFYSAFTIYSLQHHISVWAQALSSPSSQSAIYTVAESDTLADSNAQTATSVLATLIYKYGRDHDADDALVRLLEAEPNSTKVPLRPATPHGRVPAHFDEPAGAAWQPILKARLAEVLALAMGDFEFFLETVRTGAYCDRGLAVVGQLEEALKKQ